MARKLFESEADVDELLDRYSKENGVKIGKKNKSVSLQWVSSKGSTNSGSRIKLYLARTHGRKTKQRYY